MQRNCVKLTPDKGNILVQIAGWNEHDPRLTQVAALVEGTSHDEHISLRLLRMRDAARETSLSRTTLWRAIRDGRLAAVEIRAGSFRIAEHELRRFVAGK